MRVKGIAINADAGMLDGNLEVLNRELQYFRDLGFSHVEIAPHGVGVIYNGIINRTRMAELLQILWQYPFRYVVHAPNAMNLMNMDDGVTERNLFEATIEFTTTIGAAVMVYHAGRFLPEEKFMLTGQEILTPLKRAAMWEREKTMLYELGDIAAEHGLTIAVENTRPYLEARHYCYGETLDQLAAMMRQIDHPQVGVALDAGHAYLTACHYQYDLLAGVEALAPYVRHIHLHDNFGKCCTYFAKKQQYELTATGRGDMHMPIGWGAVPVREILTRLPNYHGVVTLEIHPRYRAYYGEALRNTQELLECITD
ncbi:sugar phosphate isomerase/epimerase family protein [Methylomusa anaerophila]|uniref:Endonuclease IV n=1 Tax=Methylomusa anaerophila TaxID=1930071 RepID=A0A348ALV0_9FIRM|nr:sugar phosphate isomerase/epimerase [Methylomusa anaerophila]BBB92048.1 endonuclease IV [Methylomusa anaerophila]